MEQLFATNLSRARQLRGLSLEDLATMVNCSKQAISYYENGSRRPDSTMQLFLAEAMGHDVDYFYNEPSVTFKLHNVNYREGMQLTSVQRSKVEELASARLNDYLELERIAKELVVFSNPLEDLTISNTYDAEKAAKQLRKKWKLGEEPIYNISGFLERKGVRVLKIDFGFHYSHEGLSGWAEDNRVPVIILNARQQYLARIRFTILHELGHLLLGMHDSLELDDIERICDAFAGAVLLPAEILVQEFGRGRTAISMPELRRIMELYGISVKAIMVRARFTNLITYNAYTKWLNADYPENDYGQYNGTEEPQKFLQMLYRCLSERKIGFDKASQLSGWHEAELKQIFKQQVEF